MNYKVCLTTKVRALSAGPGKSDEDAGILVLEPEDYTDKELKDIKARGYTLLGYLSAGTISTERPWYKAYSKYKLKRLPDWPKEYYMDLKETAWRDFLVSRAADLKERGFDGWWIDNIDVYEEYKSREMFQAVFNTLLDIKAVKGYTMINGGSEWLDDALDRKVNISNAIDGYTQEEVFSLITSYSGKGKFGKQEASQKRFYQELLMRVSKAKTDTFLLEYTRDGALEKSIADWCDKSHITGYYISKDVDL